MSPNHRLALALALTFSLVPNGPAWAADAGSDAGSDASGSSDLTASASASAGAQQPEGIGPIFQIGGGGGIAGGHFEIGGSFVGDRAYIGGTWEAGAGRAVYGYQVVAVHGGAVLPSPSPHFTLFVGGRMGVGGGVGFLTAPVILRPTAQFGLIARPPGSRSGIRVTLDAGVVNHVGRVLDLDETYHWAYPQLGVQVAWIIGQSTSVRR